MALVVERGPLLDARLAVDEKSLLESGSGLESLRASFSNSSGLID